VKSPEGSEATAALATVGLALAPGEVCANARERPCNTLGATAPGIREKDRRRFTFASSSDDGVRDGRPRPPNPRQNRGPIQERDHPVRGRQRPARNWGEAARVGRWERSFESLEADHLVNRERRAKIAVFEDYGQGADADRSRPQVEQRPEIDDRYDGTAHVRHSEQRGWSPWHPRQGADRHDRSDLLEVDRA